MHFAGSVHYALCRQHCSWVVVCSMHYALCSVRCLAWTNGGWCWALYVMHYALTVSLCSAKCALYIMHFAACCMVWCSMHLVHCTMQTAVWGIWQTGEPIHYALGSVHCALCGLCTAVLYIWAFAVWGVWRTGEPIVLSHADPALPTHQTHLLRGISISSTSFCALIAEAFFPRDSQHCSAMQWGLLQ